MEKITSNPLFSAAVLDFGIQWGLWLVASFFSNREILRFSRLVHLHPPDMANAAMGWKISPSPVCTVWLRHIVGASFGTSSL